MFILCNFLVRTLQYFQKKLNLFFAHENINKQASKVAHNQPQTFFSQYCLAAQTSQELIFHIIDISQDSSVSLSVMEMCVEGRFFFKISQCEFAFIREMRVFKVHVFKKATNNSHFCFDKFEIVF